MANELKDPELMSLDELRAAALAEDTSEAREAAEKAAEEEVAAQLATKTAEEKAAIDKKAAEEAEVVIEDEPEEFIQTRQIDLGDGSGIQIFTGKGTSNEEAFEDLTNKLIEAQTNATRKIREQSKVITKTQAEIDQAKKDEEYVYAQKMKTNPVETTRELVAKAQQEIQERNQRSLNAQTEFVNTHPDYIADSKTGNGDRLVKEFISLFPQAKEFTAEGFDKAYQSLKKSGLLQLKAEEASVPTEAERLETERIAQAQRNATQTRSSKKSSTVSTRGNSAPVVKPGPSEDELYALPMEKLKELANKQMASRE